MSRLQRARAICVVVVTVLAGAPILAATCELTCADSIAKSHHSSSHATHQHAAATHDHNDVRSVIKLASEGDCCRDRALTASATLTGRIDAKVFVTAYSLIPVSAPFVHAIQAAPATPARGAPPGRSPASALPLPLRI